MGAEQLVVLFDGEVVLYHWSDGTLTPRARQTVPSAVDTVRHPGGRLRAVEAESAFWLLTSRNPKAALYTVEEGRLVPRDQADALPWPGSSTGLRYRPGTDWLLGTVEGLGNGPFLALTSTGDRVAVTPEGRLLGHGEAADEDPRLGPTLAALWPGYVAASLAVPPGKPDALVVVGPLRLRPLPTTPFPLSGSVRALTSRLEGAGTRVLAVLEDDRGFSLLEMRLERAR
jgi:hypothetical protein